jgi:AraC-like DNA-binding protein
VTGGSRLEYDRRVNRVIDHIRRHLAEELSLAELARVAVFSPFHFARVFKAATGETLFGFIQRLRIERAATALVNRPIRRPSRSPWITGSARRRRSRGRSARGSG